MSRKLLLGAALAAACMAPAAAAAATSAPTFSDHAIIARDIVPSGQPGAVPPPAGADRQAQMYDALTPLFNKVSARRGQRRLQGRDARRRGHGPVHLRARAAPGRDDQARRVRRAAHLRKDPRRRDLGRRMGPGGGPRSAAPAGAVRLAGGRRRRCPASAHSAWSRASRRSSRPPRPNARSPSRPATLLAKGAKGRAVLHDIDVYLAGHQRVLPCPRRHHAAVHPYRHLRVQRAEGPVRRRGRRRRAGALGVPDRAATEVRPHEGPQDLERPARGQRPRGAGHRPRQGAVPEAAQERQRQRQPRSRQPVGVGRRRRSPPQTRSARTPATS